MRSKLSDTLFVKNKNAAQYTISASCDPLSLETEEVKPVDPAWIGVCSEITFIPPKNVQPEPPSPGDPNVSALTGTNSWTTKVSAPYAGQWKLKFTATVTYYVWDKKKEEYVLNEDGTKATFGPYSGAGTCQFKATAGNFRIVLQPDDNFEGRSLSVLGVGETGTGGNAPNDGKIYVEPIGNTLLSDILPLQDFSSNNENAFKMESNLTSGTATFIAGDVKGNTVVTATDKNGNSETYAIDVLQPQTIRMELQNILMVRNAPSPRPFLYKNNVFPYAFIVRIHLVTYIEPTEVSFFNIRAYEGYAKYNLQGDEIKLYADNNLNIHHKEWTKKPKVSRGNIVKGCYVLGPTAANTLPKNPLPYDSSGTTRPEVSGMNAGYGPGTSTISIPWKYDVGNTVGESIQNVNVTRSFNGTKATLTKNAVSWVFDYFP